MTVSEMNRARLLSILVAFMLADPTLQGSAAAEPSTIDYSADLPRIKPLEPAEAVKSIDVLPGFRIEQVAAEPLVRDPVALDFDENGRLFVVEMCDYSEQDKKFLGVARLLEDTDGDGRYDKSTIYAEALSWPTAVICFDGGIFVGAAPDIYYLKDTDGDGRADERKTVFTGFSRSNVQGLLNSFRWGLDNRIHGATGTVGGRVTRPDEPGFKPVDLNGRDFSFDPRRLDLRAESGGAQHGMSFDDWGRKFVCSNSDHLQMVMYEDRYVARNPFFSPSPARLSIAADGPQAEVFRLSPVEPWRIIRTRIRVSGNLPGAAEGGGRAAGYFTGATGATIYRGGAFPEEYRGQAFIGDVGSNLVHRKVLEEDGVALVAKRVDEGREFVASRDIWFRPAQFANAPDGTLYITDVYREVIEHPQSLPPEIKQHLDLTSGRDRGRIYRVVAEGFVQPALPKLSQASTDELVRTLEHRNGWHRDTAARLLYERQDRSAVVRLEQLIETASLPEARLHALYALQGLGALKAENVLCGLKDPHPRVREHAVRLAEDFAAKSPEIRDNLYELAVDDDIRVRYQLAFTLGELSDEKRFAVLAQLARRDAGDPSLCSAILSSLESGAVDVLALLTADDKFRGSTAGESLLAQLAELVGAQARRQELRRFDVAVATIPATEQQVAEVLVRGLIAGGQRPQSDSELAPLLPSTYDIWVRLIESSQTAALEETRPLPERQHAVRTLALGRFKAVSGTLGELLGSRQPQEVQSAAIESLGRFDNDAVAQMLLAAWPGMSPPARAAATEVLFSRQKWALSLLEAIDSGSIPLSELDPVRLHQLLAQADAGIRERSQSLLAKLQVGPRQDVVEGYRSALSLRGNAEAGKVAFQRTCAACHRLEGVGHEIGPNLATIRNRGAEAILFNVLDPNREVNPQYVNYVVLTAHGRIVSGMIAGETATSLTLKRADNATDIVKRSEIEEMRSTGQSIMPEGMEKQVDQQMMADLIAYLMAVH